MISIDARTGSGIRMCGDDGHDDNGEDDDEGYDGGERPTSSS